MFFLLIVVWRNQKNTGQHYRWKSKQRSREVMPSGCKVNGLRQRVYFLVVIKKGQTGPVHMENTKNSHHKSNKAFMLINTMRENHISSPTFFLITVIIS